MKASRNRAWGIRTCAVFTGFLTLTLGFLTSRADSLADAFACRDGLAQGELERDHLLRQADSLGAKIDEARRGGKGVPQSWLRQAERIKSTAMDRELDLLARREHCRVLSETALRFCGARIQQLQSLLESGRGNAEASAELLRLQGMRGELEGSQAGPAVVGYPLLPEDSTDTQETLKAKLQYYDDVQGYLVGLGQRISKRRHEVQEEQRSLQEAQRFLQDLALIDEGGRVSSGGAVQIRGGSGGDGVPDGAVGRSAGGSADLPNRAGDLEFVLGLAPATPEESNRLVQLLDGFRREIQRELETVASERAKVASRILPELSPPR